MHHQELKKLRVELQSALVRMMRGSSGVQFDHEEFAVACHALTWEVLAFHDFMDHSPRIVDDVWCSRLKPSSSASWSEGMLLLFGTLKISHFVTFVASPASVFVWL